MLVSTSQPSSPEPLSMLFDYWSRLPAAECIHPDDRGIIEPFSHKFELDVPPGHVNGQLRTAPVVVCFLNPGFEEIDRPVFTDPTSRRALFEQIDGASDFPLWFERWRQWFVPRVRFGGRSDQELARLVAILNVFPYASRNAKLLTPALVRDLPSAQVARRYLHGVLIPAARRGERFVVIARGRWAWQFDASLASGNVRLAPNPRGGHLGPAIGDAINNWIARR